MNDAFDKDLLSRLARGDLAADGSDPWASVAAAEPDHDAIADPASEAVPSPVDTEAKLEAMLDRLHGLVDDRRAPRASSGDSAGQDEAEHLANPFVPLEPTSLGEADLTESSVEALILKYLLARGNATGRDIADQVKLPFVLISDLLWRMKNEQLVVHRGAAPMNDYEYQPTEFGQERARRYAMHCTYFGSAPVALPDYIASVHAQSLNKQHPTADDLGRAFDDLVLNRKMLDRLGPAVNSGRGLFLYGPPGNGKTSIAERVTIAFGKYIWIPRAISIDGEIIRLFDPVNHVVAPVEETRGLIDQRKIDRRWIRIRRPTIVAGGELTMAALEVSVNVATGINEAPLQLKSNCGILVIDDFGRQRIRIDELLNRWIVPLEKRYDFLNLPNGKKVSVPFDQLIVFSTNLEPRELVDEAFLRRIPYKIEIVDPTEVEFRYLFEVMAEKLGFTFDPSPIDYLIEEHYRKVNRPLRFCQPRDLLLQIRNYCVYFKRPLEMTNEYFDRAVENYFAVM
ncbi:MAG: AAA family ATPase [Planctomycetia bacterium]|nr:AAA family ATPase [Planctomycetia bacterium]